MTSPASHRGPDDPRALEQKLLERVRAGDERAFEEIFRAYLAPLCNFAFSYLQSREHAEEIVQDLFASLWEQRFTLEMPHGMRPYLFTAVRNRSLNALSHRRVELSARDRLSREADAAPIGTGVDSPHDAVVAADLGEAIDLALVSMPPRSREVFTLLRRQHLSYAEVSQVLGISQKTVEIHMSRALAFLRERLASWLRP